MNTTQRTGIMQRGWTVQNELLPELNDEIGSLTPKLVKVIHTLEWVRIEAARPQRSHDSTIQVLTKERKMKRMIASIVMGAAALTAPTTGAADGKEVPAKGL